MEVDTREVVNDFNPRFRRLWMARYEFDLSYTVEVPDLENAGFFVSKLHDPEEFSLGFKFLTEPTLHSTLFTITRSPAMELTRETWEEATLPGVCFNLETSREGDSVGMYQEETVALAQLIQHFEALKATS